jgi:hypothetical protein
MSDPTPALDRTEGSIVHDLEAYNQHRTSDQSSSAVLLLPVPVPVLSSTYLLLSSAHTHSHPARRQPCRLPSPVQTPSSTSPQPPPVLLFYSLQYLALTDTGYGTHAAPPVDLPGRKEQLRWRSSRGGLRTDVVGLRVRTGRGRRYGWVFERGEGW